MNEPLKISSIVQSFTPQTFLFNLCDSQRFHRSNTTVFQIIISTFFWSTFTDSFPKGKTAPKKGTLWPKGLVNQVLKDLKKSHVFGHLSFDNDNYRPTVKKKNNDHSIIEQAKLGNVLRAKLFWFNFVFLDLKRIFSRFSYTYLNLKVNQ